MVVVGGGGGGGGGGGAFVTFNPRRPFNFYWNNNCIILPKSVDLPQVSASMNAINSTHTLCRHPLNCIDHAWLFMEEIKSLSYEGILEAL